MRDNSLRECLNDQERLLLCEIAGVVKDAVADHLAEQVMRVPTKSVTRDYNVVTIDTFEHGQLEITVRKKF